MNLQRLLFILLSAAALAGLGYVSVRVVASMENRVVPQAQLMLEAAAESLSYDLELRVDRLERWALAIQPAVALPAGVRALAAVNALVPPGGEPGERLRARIDEIRGQLDDELAKLRTEHPEIDSVALIDAAGVVVHSSSGAFPVGMRLAAEPVPERADDADAETAETAAKPPEGVEAAVALALAGGTGRSVVVADDGVRLVAAGALVLRGRPAGAALLVRRLGVLPTPAGVSSFLVARGKVLQGMAPSGFVPAAEAPEATQKPTLLQQREVSARLGALGEVGVGPWLVDRTQVGVWGLRFSLPGTRQVSGYLLADVQPAMAELGGVQLVLVTTAVLVWLVHLVMLALSGRRLRVGASRIADFLGRAQQGKAVGKPLDERQFVPEFRRLVVLVNKVVSQGQAPQELSALSSAPSIDDVLKAHSGDVGGAGDLEFEGITNAGSIESPPPFAGVEEPTRQMMRPTELDDEHSLPVADADGYESLAEVGDATLFGDAETELAPDLVDELPGAVEANAAVEHLTPEPSGPTTSPLQEAVPPRKGDTSATAKAPIGDLLDEFAPDATIVRPLSQDEIARLHMAAEKPRSQSGHSQTKGQSSPVRVAPAPTSAAPSEDVEFRRVFEAFVTTREQCGESIAGLTFDKFVTRLQQSRDAVIAKHACTDVRFEVYVKEGKAALKATPAR